MATHRRYRSCRIASSGWEALNRTSMLHLVLIMIIFTLTLVEVPADAASSKGVYRSSRHFSLSHESGGLPRRALQATSARPAPKGFPPPESNTQAHPTYSSPARYHSRCIPSPSAQEPIHPQPGAFHPPPHP